MQIRQGFILAIIVIGMLIGYGMLRYPLIVREAGLLSLLAPALMLLLYGVVAITITHQPSQARSDALKSGTAFGLLVGITFVTTIFVENFVDMSGQISTISTLGFMLLIFLTFAYTGWHATNRSNQLSLGILASVWSSMIGVGIALLRGQFEQQGLDVGIDEMCGNLRTHDAGAEDGNFSNDERGMACHLSSLIEATARSSRTVNIQNGVRLSPAAGLRIRSCVCTGC
jgi:hypothetical protein